MLGAAAVGPPAVVFRAIALFGETTAAHRFSDEPAHVVWVRRAAQRISAYVEILDVALAVIDHRRRAVR